MTTQTVERTETKQTDAKSSVTPSAYCVKCQTVRSMSGPHLVTLKNGREATQGNCPECGTKILKLGR
jgi:hypothetical protein